MADYGSLPFQEAIQFLLTKRFVPTERWDDLRGPAHDNAFVVAGAMSADLLGDLHAAVLDFVADGASIETFAQSFEQIVAQHGWTGWTGEGTPAGRAWRIRVIAETNLRTAYQAGRRQQQIAVATARPWWRYRHSVGVEQPRELHQSWDGLTIRFDDPWWETHYPPNGYGCRCYVETYSDDELQRRGLEGGPPPDDGDRVIPREDGTSIRVPNGIDPGWDHAPGATRDLLEEVKAKAERLPEQIAADLVADVSNPQPAPEYWDASTPAGAWHDTAFARSPTYVKEAIANTPPVTVEPPRPDSAAYQRRGEIYMGATHSDRRNRHDRAVWRHEMGHYLDYRGGRPSEYWSAANLIDPMDKDAADLRKQAGLARKSKAQQARVEELKAAYAGARRAAQRMSDDTALKDQATRLGLDWDRLQSLTRDHTKLLQDRVWESGDLAAKKVWRDAPEALRRERFAGLLTAIEQRDAAGILNALEGSKLTIDGSWVRRGDMVSPTFHAGAEGMLSDLYSAATKKTIEGSGGHSLAYYKQRGKPGQATEAAANLTALLGDEYADQWEVILERTTPRMLEAWRGYLQSIAKGTP